MEHPIFMIIDLGSQYTQIIRRSLRYLGFRSVIVLPEKALDFLNQNKIKGIILSGGNYSVYEAGAPKIPEEILSLNIPILGICYGMQWLAYVHDKSSIHADIAGKSYGPVSVSLSKSILFDGLADSIEAWSSHGDSVKSAPAGFSVIATSKNGAVIEAVENISKKYWGVQFHPEVEDTKDSDLILKNFAEKICGCVKNYSREDIIQEIRDKALVDLGDGMAILGLSGGVDSTTIAGMLAPMLGDKLKVFTIDTGGLRENELERIIEIAKSINIDLHVISEYKDTFIKTIGATIDSEEKRARFREVYGEAFKKVARDFGATHVIQGTLATDLIESGSSGSSALIKKHHNVDLDFGLKEITPLADFFKFEVRGMAEELGLGDIISKRQPFPGPGLFLRIVGMPVTGEFLELVREADAEVAAILIKHGVYEKISQTVVALLGFKSVGVKGDARVYGYTLAVRTVATKDFMTIKSFYLDPAICDEIISTLSKHAEIVRVVFDWTPKPPATTEFE